MIKLQIFQKNTQLQWSQIFYNPEFIKEIEVQVS